MQVGNGGEPKALDPHTVTGVIEERILSALFEGLVNLDLETMEPVPGVAESWEISENGTVYRFLLRNDARWSNGDPVTAHNFVYSWRRILSPAFAAEYAYMLYPIENAEAYHAGAIEEFDSVGVRALDSRTLEVRLRAPTPWFLSLQIHFTFYPVHRPTVESHGDMLQRDTPWTRPGNMVSNGPYRLAEWVPNDRIVVERNPEYWNRNALNLERIAYRPIQNPSVEERSFRAGELHITYGVPLTKIESYRRYASPALRIDPYLGTEFIRFNTRRQPFDDSRVRRAFGLAIDRAVLTKQVMKGGQQVATSYVPPGTGGYTYGRTWESGPVHEYQAGTARRLLAEAGFPEGAGFPPTAMIYDASDNNRIYCEALQQMWQRELGVRVQLQSMDTKTWLASQMQGDYDLARSYWIGDYNDAMNFLDMYLSQSGNNRTGFANTEYETLLSQAVMSEGDARTALFRQAEDILLREAPITPVYHYTKVYLAVPQLEGLVPNILGRVNWRDLNWKRPLWNR